jgi:hypothetical protein
LLPGRSILGVLRKAATAQMVESVIAAIATVTSFGVGSFAPRGKSKQNINRKGIKYFMGILCVMIIHHTKENNLFTRKRHNFTSMVH